MYQKLDSLDKRMKPLILKWLCDLFEYKGYPHSFRDQWINWTVWDNQLSISFDLRQPEQIRLLSLIHPRFRGVPQNGTLIIVNENNFYLTLDRIGKINYPNINGFKLLHKTKRTDDGDIFYSYDWEVMLDDNTSIAYHNQTEKMDLKHRDFIYDSTIEQRFFVNMLLEKYEPTAIPL